MNQKLLRSISENIAGLFFVLVGLLILIIILWINGNLYLAEKEEPPPEPVKAIAAQIVDGAALQKTLDAREQAKIAQQLAHKKALEEAQRRAAAAEELLKKQKQETKKLQQKAAAEQHARKIAEEKAQKSQQEAAKERQQREKEQQKRKDAEKKLKEEQANKERQQREELKKKQAESKKQAKLKKQRELAAREERERKKKRELEQKLAAIDAPDLKDTINSIQNSVSDDQKNEMLAQFGSAVKKKMEKYWQIPPHIPSNLTADIFVLTDKQGNILKAKISKSSGYPLFDNAALATLYKAAPYQLPPEGSAAQQEIISVGIIFKFAQ